MHWCRRWIRLNEVREKVPKVPEKVWEALVHSQVRFNRVPDQVQQEKVPGSLGANRVPEKVPGERLGGFGGEPGQVQPEKVCRALRETGRYLRRRLQIGFHVQNQF